MSKKAFEVAEFIINHADVNNLQLQKLLYFAKRHSKHFFRKPIFKDKFEKWRYGPVLVDVYKKYKMYSDRQLPKTDKKDYPMLSKKEEILLLNIIEKYKEYTAFDLARESLEDKKVKKVEVGEIIKL